MEYANHLNEYTPAWSQERVDEEVARIRKVAESRNHNTEVYKFCYSAIDLTTLSCNDSATSVTEFARKAVEFLPGISPHPECGLDLHLSRFRRNGRRSRGRYADAHYKRCRRISRIADLP